MGLDRWETRIRQRFFRRPVNQPEGLISHDGDCYIYARHICTCGLLHELVWHLDKASELYPNFSVEYANHLNVLDLLFMDEAVREKVKEATRPRTPEEIEAAKKFIDKIFPGWRETIEYEKDKGA